MKPVNRTLGTYTCEQCGGSFQRPKAWVDYHHVRNGLRLFCSKACFYAFEKTDTRTPEQKKADKKAYDAEYRAKNRAKIKALKAQRYQAQRNPEKEREYRKANMARHVEYCRRPEYKAYKTAYDRGYRAKKDYGEFAEAALALLDIKSEIDSRVSREEVYQTNGTQNKSIQRKREYARSISNHT